MNADSQSDVVMRPLRLLCVAFDGRLLRRLRDSVDLYGCRLDAVAGSGIAVMRLTAGEYDAVLVQHLLVEAEIAGFLAWLRAPRSPARRLPVILTADRGDLLSAERFLGLGATRILDAALAPHLLRLVLREVLDVAPRFRLSATVRLGPPTLQRASLPTLTTAASLCSTVNLSASGMLVQTDRNDPPGSLMPFELELPDNREPLRGWAEVIRSESSPVGSDPALGLRIRSFSRDGLYRYNAYLERQTA
jgi:hypothetical protein